jgi:hypothetical protein
MAKLDYKTVMEELRIQRYKEMLNYDKVVDLGVESMWKELCAQVTSQDVDPTDIFSEEMEYLRDLEYSMKLMNICCLCETWEQDLYNFLKEKGLVEILSNDYPRTRQIFEGAYPECKISEYSEIEEMRALVNAIKHGEGYSLTNIRRMTSEAILADSAFGVMDENGEVIRKKQIEFDVSTLTSRTLKIDGKLALYSDAVVRFWQDVFKADKEKESGRVQE